MRRSRRAPGTRGSVAVVVCAINRGDADPLEDIGVETRAVLTRADLDAAKS